MEDKRVESALRAHLAASLGRQRFELWFGEPTQFRLTDRALTVLSASAFTRDWLRRNFLAEVRECCAEVCGRDMDVEFEADESLGSSPANSGDVMACAVEAVGVTAADCDPSATPCSAGRETTASIKRAEQVPSKSVRLEPTLAEFVVGACNEYAHSAASMIARGSQQASPVLFCGPTSTGKTHLLRSLRREFRHNHPRSRAVYLTAEQFTTTFVEALRGTGLPSFRQKCRGADLLLIDDLQFFAGKRASLNELLYTLDTMQAEGRQVALASDRTLAQLQSLGKELVSRLSGGLVCEVQLPDFTTRREIVRRLAREMAMALSDEVASLVATHISAGARELGGALYRLQAVSAARRQPITEEVAGRELADLAQQFSRNVRLSDVEQAVCDVFGVEAAQLRSDRKSRSINEPRMLAMWLARKYTRAPWSEIGQFFGRRSHSTVIAAHRRVEHLIRTHSAIGVSHETCGVEEAIRRVETAIRTA